MSPPSSPTPQRLANNLNLMNRKTSSKPARSIAPSPSQLITPPSTPNIPRKATRKRQLSGDQTTESVGSEDVQPSGSGYFDLDQERSLDDQFPSIPRVIEALNRAYFVDEDFDSFRSLGDIFANIVLTVSTNIENNSQMNRTSERFLLAKFVVRLLLRIFRNVVEKVALDERIEINKMFEMREAYEHAVMVHDSLKCLHRIGLKRSLTQKPLPPLPPPSVLPSTSLPASPPKTPPRSVTPGQSTLSTQVRKHSTTSLRTTQATPTPKDRSFKWPRNVSDSSNSGIKTPQTPPSPRKPFSPPMPLEKTLDGPRSEEIYNQRWTAVYFGDSGLPCNGTTLEEGAEGLELNRHNEIIAATLPALIRILTSREGLETPSGSHLILASFRQFATPTEFFDELKKRFDAKPPSSLDTTNPQDASKWSLKLANIHTRVLAVIYSWLDQHWKIDTDNAILDDIRAFLDQIDDRDIPRGVVPRIVQKIDDLEHCSAQDLFEKQLSHIAAVESLPSAPPEPTHFVFPKTFPTSSLEGLDLLDMKEGRMELARHLTLKMSELHRRLDPTKVVKFCYDVGDDKKIYAKCQDQVSSVREFAAIGLFNEQLSFWVMSSVVEREELHKRAHVLGFWIEVALLCMEHNNYATASNIYLTLKNRSIARMKESILAAGVSESFKLDYEKLSDFFKNSKPFKETFNDLLPSIPLPNPLLHDIFVTKSYLEQESRFISSPAETPSPNSPSKLIPLLQCRANQRAIRCLNKALIEYKFERNGPLASWLEDCIRSFSFSTDEENKAICKRLDALSLKVEPCRKELEYILDPWDFITAKPTDFLMPAPSDQKMTAKRLLSLLRGLKRPRN